MRCRRIIYVQYTNPAGYPPLEHSSRILADRGWEVLFLGTGAHGGGTLAFPEHRSIAVRYFKGAKSGWRQKAHYLAYGGWVLTSALRFQPDWIYASDPLSCPIGLVLRRATGARVLYHEHDSPNTIGTQSTFMRHILAARHKLARGADICVLPQLHRLELFKVQTGRVGSTFCVWNCPRKDEVGTPKAAPAGPLNFYYHGNVSPPRLPLTVIQALARASTQARLTIVGYETVGSQGYAQKLLAVSEQLGLGDRVRYRGAMQRQSCLAMASEADVGLSLMPMSDTDPNLSSMVGASNKAFDYLARGMALLVSDLPDWRDAYVNAGMALACDPSDVESLCSAIVWCEHNRDKLRLMGERGSEKIIEQWNYESQFAPVTAQLETA